MKAIGVIFVKEHSLPGRLVKLFTNSPWAHVGIILEDGKIFESIAPKITVSEHCKYFGVITEIFWLDVPDKAYDRLTKFIKRTLSDEVRYGLDDCVIACVEAWFGTKAAGVVGRIIGNRNTWDCSCTSTKALREMGIDVLPGMEDAAITPSDLYAWLSVCKDDASNKRVRNFTTIEF